MNEELKGTDTLTIHAPVIKCDRCGVSMTDENGESVVGMALTAFPSTDPSKPTHPEITRFINMLGKNSLNICFCCLAERMGVRLGAQKTSTPEVLVCDACGQERHPPVYLEMMRTRLAAYNVMLRELCSWLGVGGHNESTPIDPVVANDKIRSGVDHIVAVETKRREEAEARLAAAAQDVKRLEFVLPVLCGASDNASDHRTVLLAKALALGNDGRDVIDTAMRAEAKPS